MRQTLVLVLTQVAKVPVSSGRRYIALRRSANLRMHQKAGPLAVLIQVFLTALWPQTVTCLGPR